MSTIDPATAAYCVPAELKRIQTWRGLAALTLDWLLIAACFTLAILYPHPLVMLAAAILIARTQLALAVLMHDSAHGTLLRPRRFNDLVGQLFTAAPLMLSLYAYRHGHLEHHRAPMAPDDPVATIFGIADYPVSRTTLAWRLLRDVTGLAYFLSLRDFARGRFRHLSKAVHGRAATAWVLCSILMVHGALVSLLWLADRPELYLLLWTLPSLTLLQLFARMRALTEHAGFPFAHDQTRNARSIVAPSWQTFFCGPHAIHYHIEHHAHVRVPFYHLQTLHHLMRSCGALHDANLHHGYASVLREVSSAAPQAHANPEHS